MIKNKCADFVAILTLMVWVGASHSSDAQPDAVAHSFYDVLIKLQIRGLPDEKEMAAIGPFLTKEIKQGVKLAKAEHDKFVQRNDTQALKPPWTKEGNLFASLWEGMHSYKIGAGAGDDKTLSYPVYLSYTDKTGSVEWIDVLILENTTSGWKVKNIYLNGPWGFRTRGSLLDNLPSEDQ
jgi:hypothetical protein